MCGHFVEVEWESVRDTGLDAESSLPFCLLSGIEFSTSLSWPVRFQV